jgi:fatty acid amide hydrolase 2
MPIQDPRTVRVDKLRVFTVVDDGRHDIAPDLRTAQARAARALEARGARVEQTALKELREAFDLWGDSLRETADRTFGNWVGEGEEIALGIEWGRALLGKRRHTDMALFFVLLERVSGVIPLVKGGYPKMLAFRERIGSFLGDDGVLLLPPFPSTAPKHGQSARTPRGFVLSGLWNMLEMPSTSVPISRDGHGMPTGTQVIGPHGADGRTIAVALALDEDLRGYQPPRL